MNKIWIKLRIRVEKLKKEIKSKEIKTKIDIMLK